MSSRLTHQFNLAPKSAAFSSVAFVLVLTFMVQESAAQSVLNVWRRNGPGGGIRSIAVDANNLDIMYSALGQSYVYRTINNGSSWSLFEEGLQDSIVTSLAIDPSNPNILYAGSYDGVFKSINGGANWSRDNTPVGAFRGLVAISPSDPDVIYSATNSNLLVTGDGGATWNSRRLPRLFPEMILETLNIIMVHPQNPRIIYTGFTNSFETYFSRLYVSDDAGVNWSEVDVRPGLGVDTYSLRIDPNNTNIIYDATYHGIYKSTNGGGSWTWRGSPGPDMATLALAVDPLNPGTLYAGGFVTYGCFCSTGVYKSTNDGETWSSFNIGLTNLQVNQLEFDRSGKFLHAATEDGIFSVQVREAPNFSVSGRVTTPDGRGLRVRGYR
jgi:photosystem II stability/assembly factor-like uncharacterized protein